MLSATRTVSIALALSIPATAIAAQNNTMAPDPFSQQVEQKCTEAVGDVFRRPMIAVDPSGTESYGVAIVYGRSKELKGPAAVICVVDRKSGKVELGTPLGKEVVRVRKPKPDGQDNDNVKQKPNKKMQSQSNNTGNVGSQDDGDDDQQ